MGSRVLRGAVAPKSVRSSRQAPHEAGQNITTIMQPMLKGKILDWGLGMILDLLVRVGTTLPALRLKHQNRMCRLHPEIASTVDRLAGLSEPRLMEHSEPSAQGPRETGAHRCPTHHATQVAVGRRGSAEAICVWNICRGT